MKQIYVRYALETSWIYLCACGPYTKHHAKIRTFRETGNLKHLYRNELDKSCFAHDAAHSDSEDLGERTSWDKILKDSAYEIARNHKYDGDQRTLASMVYKFFDKRTGSRTSVNKELAEEIHKHVIKKFKRRKVFARFKENNWAADLADMGSCLIENIYYMW